VAIASAPATSGDLGHRSRPQQQRPHAFKPPLREPGRGRRAKALGEDPRHVLAADAVETAVVFEIVRIARALDERIDGAIDGAGGARAAFFEQDAEAQDEGMHDLGFGEGPPPRRSASCARTRSIARSSAAGRAIATTSP